METLKEIKDKELPGDESNYEGPFIQKRDLEFLKKAKQILLTN